MTNTTNLGLPFLAAGQAQKHVTLNEMRFSDSHTCRIAGPARKSWLGKTGQRG